MIAVLKSANLALAFLLELAMLAAFGYWGFKAGDGTVMKILLAIGLPLITAVIWGVFMAPQSARRLKGTAYLGLKVLLFALAVVALFAAGNSSLGILLAVAFVINTVLLEVWK